MKRSSLTFLLLLPALALLIACEKRRPDCPDGTVALYSGCLRSQEINRDYSRPIHVHRGIPYGETTAGENRFQAPVPKRPWEGVLELKPYHKTWATETERRELIQELATKPKGRTQPPPEFEGEVAFPGREDKIEWGVIPTSDCPQVYPFMNLKIGSEDCLKINVYTPLGAMRDGADLPVMVFIYGGGFYWGGTSPLFFALYDGTALASANNVVVVTFNYRLGALAGIPTPSNAGNLSILDQQLAFQWVQDEISQFGGDPDKVTIFGESSGAMSVAAHTVSAPASKGLFRAAIVESDPFAFPFPDAKQKQEVADFFLKKIGCADLACVEKKQLYRILDIQHSMRGPVDWWPALAGVFFWGPAIDGKVLTAQPIKAVRTATDTVPMILGTNQNEGTFFVALQDRITAITIPRYKKIVEALFGNDAQKILAEPRYRPVLGAQGPLSRLTGDYLFTCSTRYFAEEAVRGGNDDTFTYRFTKISPVNIDFALGIFACQFETCHAAEVPYVFNYWPLLESFPFLYPYNDEWLLATVMGQYWTGMAKGLKPVSSSPLMPDWKAWSGGKKPYINLNISLLPPATVVMEEDPFKETCEFWDEIGYENVFPSPI